MLIFPSSQKDNLDFHNYCELFQAYAKQNKINSLNISKYNTSMLSIAVLYKLKQTWSATSPCFLPSLLAGKSSGGTH